MRRPAHTVAWSGHDVAADLAQAVLEVTRTHSAALTLPGLWDADQVLEKLGQETTVLHIDGAITGGANDCPLIVALLAEGIVAEAPPPEAVGDHLRRWAKDAGQREDRLPLVVLESAEHLDTSGEQTLLQLTRQGLLRLVVLLPTQTHIPEFLRALEETGRLTELSPEAVTEPLMASALQRRLGGAVSAAARQRISALSGGHRVLIERILTAAETSGVLHRDGRIWMWAADETPVHQGLAQHSAELLSGLTDQEQELLIVLAGAGSLPERWACAHFGEDVVLSLRRQAILAADLVQQQGYLDLKLLPEAIAYALRVRLGTTELTRLWYKIGQHIPAAVGGPASQAALTWWASVAGEQLDTAVAEQASRLCIVRSWYHHVADIVAAAEEITPTLRAAWARAELALGHVGQAVTQLEQLITSLTEEPRPGSPEAEAQRQGIILARRLQIFHPERAEPLLAGLLASGEAGHAHHLERVLNLPVEEDPETWLRELVTARASGVWDEAICAQLWLATRLGLRQHPNLGRLLLASLLDDLIREGGHPDVEDAAAAVLLLISMGHDWHTDLLRVDLQAWSRKPVTSPMLAGVADLVTSIVSMQHDTMVTAHAHAVSALAAFEVADTYGLERFGSSLVAATASYVDEDLSAAAHHDHRTRILPKSAPGLPWVRLLSQGFALIGSGPPRHEVAAALAALGREASDAGEWNQEQQLLLLSMLGGNRDAAKQALSAAWVQQPGRARMIHLLASNLLTLTDREALRAAQMLILAGASFFGLSIIAARWTRRAQMERSIRVETVRTVLTLRQQATERSELLESFEDLELDDRERAVVAGLLQGRSTQTIARRLSLSPRTVEAAISALLQRFGCENRVELISLDLLASRA